MPVNQELMLGILCLIKVAGRGAILSSITFCSSFSPGTQPAYSKTRKEQVAIIAQKVTYANQPKKPRGSLVTLPNPRAMTLWAFLCEGHDTPILVSCF
jgi:hypothetical protein